MVRAHIARRRLACAGARTLFVLVTAGPLAAQSAVDSAAFIGLLVTPAGAFPTPASGTVAGATTAGIALSALYGYVPDSPAPGTSANVAGVRLDLRLPGGAINLSATGGRRFASCLPHPPTAGEMLLDVECHDLWMAGASVTARLVRANVGDGFSSGCLTVSLEAQAGAADDARRAIRSALAAEARAGAAGLTVALAAPGDGTTGVLYVTPALARAHVDTRRIVPRLDGSGALAGADTIPLEQEGERFMVSGGFALLRTRSGVGLHVTAQKVFIRGGDVAVGGAVTLASPWGRKPLAGGSRERLDEEVRAMIQRGTVTDPPACRRLSGH